MARFHGRVGYGESVETESGSGIWADVITEREYTGDVIQVRRGLDPTADYNTTLTVQNIISIVADDYANDRFFAIRYVAWMGALWTVTDIQVQRPRLLLSLGEVYNGPRA
jgi:hypothetical protein